MPAIDGFLSAAVLPASSSRLRGWKGESGSVIQSNTTPSFSPYSVNHHKYDNLPAIVEIVTI